MGQGGFLEVYKNVQEERKKFKFERNRQDTRFKGEHRIEEKTLSYLQLFFVVGGHNLHLESSGNLGSFKGFIS